MRRSAIDKGCYLGQEVVARLHFRGQASRLMRGVVLDTDNLPPVGVALLADGREAGRLTSVGRSPQLDRVIGLSILQRRATEPGTRLVVEGTEPGRGGRRAAVCRTGRSVAEPVGQTENEEPQPHEPLAFGLLNLKPAPAIPMT